ncbi:transporter substrate-binding domain-containing protein [Saccharopolyspora phatthalungensis]|uniref:ABC-type amino acid transport substrate-binding protein n=1 Tax=Saccharopolyspora phatthalungensis TaxID=664693 RepID=A0A840QC99_9PSEU|nr:transporter substrate-binding domain-containing protein [Saccharopolyspora phatthalungensis]MBB5156258.1 ABC-type amino acid transport substrate-binding protein [Saccharopolyspora phatthalungensis]
MRIRVLAAVVSATAVLSACGQSAPIEPNAVPPHNRPAPAAPVPPSPAPPAGDSVELDISPTLAKIKQRRLLLVGVRADAPQFVSRDPAGEYRGFDAEIARDLAKRIGLDPATQVQFRRLPPTLLQDAVTAGNVDVLLGGTADVPQLAAVGPYAVTDSKRYLVIKSDDRLLSDELRHMLDAAVADGSWQRAYDATLATAGISARPR